MRAVIFDWDGTLANSHSSLYEANAAVMRAFDLPFSEELYRQHYAPDWRLMYRRLGLPDERVEEANRIWQAAFHAAHVPVLLPGVNAALARLRSGGIPLGLVTAGERAIVEPQIGRLGPRGHVPGARVRRFGAWTEEPGSGAAAAGNSDDGAAVGGARHRRGRVVVGFGRRVRYGRRVRRRRHDRGRGHRLRR